jgi:hypothetical protein
MGKEQKIEDEEEVEEEGRKSGVKDDEEKKRSWKTRMRRGDGRWAWEKRS